MYTLSKKHIGFFLGAMLTAVLVVPALLGTANIANAAAAAPLTANELFGGKGAKGSEFAAEAGLGSTDLVSAITSIIRVAMGFLGIIAVIIIMLGGFKWMTAAGDDKKIGDAKKLIYAGITGLVIILAAFAIASFVINQITGITGQDQVS